jgi:hypothetical protein
MDRHQTTLIDPEFLESQSSNSRDKQGKKVFTFDYSFWSHKPGDADFSAQADVFKDLGIGIVKSALRGYNCSIFAYGQTGSGKTYTMLGDTADDGAEMQADGPGQHGVIPRTCQHMVSAVHAPYDAALSSRADIT